MGFDSGGLALCSWSFQKTEEKLEYQIMIDKHYKANNATYWGVLPKVQLLKSFKHSKGTVPLFQMPSHFQMEQVRVCVWVKDLVSNINHQGKHLWIVLHPKKNMG